MADIFTLSLQAIYRTTAVAAPDWSTESWAPYVTAPNSGEINKFAVTNPTSFIYNISHFGSVLVVMMIKNLSDFGSIEVSWNDGVHAASQNVPFGGILVIPHVSSNSNIVVNSPSGTQNFLLALAAP